MGFIYRDYLTGFVSQLGQDGFVLMMVLDQDEMHMQCFDDS